MGLKIEVDRGLCIGAGSCVDVAPAVFELDGDNIAVVKNSLGADQDTVLEAAEACPTGAVVVIDEATGKQFWPLK